MDEITIGVVTNGICGISALNVLDDYENPSAMLRKTRMYYSSRVRTIYVESKEIIAQNKNLLKRLRLR